MSVIALMVIATAFADLGPTAASRIGPAPAPTTPGLPPAVAAPVLPTPIQHVFVVMLENAKRSTVLANGPYETLLASHFASASHYYAICHPSAPNYLAITSGAPWQCGSDGYSKHSTENLGDMAQKAGLSWAGFEESMSKPCSTTDSYPYAVKHNPFVYYPDIVNNSSECRAHDVPFSAWTGDLANGTIPNFAMFTPNLTDDGHDTGVAHADQWLRGWLSPLLNDSFYRSSVFFVVYDESVNDSTGFNGTMGGQIFFTAVSPYARSGFTLTENVSHYDLLTTVEWLLGLGSTGQHDNWTQWPPLKSLFSFPNASSPLPVVATASVSAGVAPLEVNFTANATGGSAPYAYAWSFGDGAKLTGANVSHVYPSVGNYTATVVATDAAKRSGTQNLALRVVPRLSVSSLTIAPPTVALNQTVTLTTSASGGEPPLTYAYSGLPPGCGTRNLSSFSCQPSGGGNFRVDATVSDGLGQLGSVNSTLVVNGGISVTLSPPALATDVNRSVQLAATVQGGNGSFSYRWTGLPPGCDSTNASSVGCRPGLPGAYHILLWVNDSVGDSGRSFPVVLRVFPLPTVSIAATPTAGIAPLDAHFLATVVGGEPFFHYAWSVDNVSAGQSSELNWTFLLPGRSLVSVLVQDAAGAATFANWTEPILAPLRGSVAISPASISTDGTADIVARATGGEPPYTYTWTLNGSRFPVGNLSAFSFIPRGTGVYLFGVNVSDRAGDVTHNSSELSVGSGGAAPTVTRVDPWLWGFAIGLGAGVIALSVVLVRRHRRV